MNIRLISGIFKNHKITAPNSRQTHPMSERARNAIFNAIQQRIPNAEVLDAFAGTGAIQNVVEQIRELAKVKNNTLRYECDKDFSVYADYDRFVQILVNITKNANQFTDNGEILVKAWNEGKKAIVEISDTGIGIDESEIKEIWERFYKADVSRKSTKYGESGLGLAIVKSLVDSHRGKISVKSEVGKGTTFRVVFPGESEL